MEARLFVGLGFDVTTGTEDAVPEVRYVEVGETEFPSPKLEPIVVGILPEPPAVATLPDGDGVVIGTTTSTKLDVRKQT